MRPTDPEKLHSRRGPIEIPGADDHAGDDGPAPGAASRTGGAPALDAGDKTGRTEALSSSGGFPRPDRAIVEGVRRLDREALGMLFDFYFDRIYGLAYRLLGNRSLAEDATQEVFYRIQRAAQRLDPDRDPGPWIVTTALNTCRSILRSSAQRMGRASRSLDEPEAQRREVAEPSPGPEERLLARERERMVTQALIEMEEPLREVVVLHDYQGLDHKEIASALGLTHEAARKRYSRALAELGRRLRSVMA